MNADRPRITPVSRGIITTDVEVLTAFYRRHGPSAADMQPILREENGEKRIVGVVALFDKPRPLFDHLKIVRGAR